MGWTWIQAGHYYRNGKINVHKECDAIWESESNYKLIKSVMVSNIWYGAIKHNEDVFACVIRTSITNKRNTIWNFGYKDMSEDMGPYYFDCPDSILNLLTPTDSAVANEWREECRIRNAQRKQLKKAKLGTKIIVFWGDKYGGDYNNKIYTLTEGWNKKRWMCGNRYVNIPTILNVGFKFV